MDFEIVTRAGLSQSEFGQLIGVSRLTAHNYMTGKTEPHKMIQGRVTKVVDLLTKLVVRGTLPTTISPRDRDARGRMMTKLTKFIGDKVDN